ncbi:alpha-amylase family glycosyl hydrolase [Thermus filiformis]|uniref:Maltodextrin glucosidase n=1 Tax=Thermus filiformis TaxID=276 RepID=A0A0A2WQ59_THEFI|nr:alpha-amylase family glycosyl hydrolase [Thermus filiformis]KGQ21958.1 maltodextrin glucosidase [Thermus filiformis]
MSYHDFEEACVDPLFPELGERVRLRVWTRAKEGFLVYEEGGELHRKALRPFPGGLEASLPLPSSPFRYVFFLREEAWAYLGSHGPEPALPRYDRFFHLLARPLPPAWALGAVFYQIFPDRFRLGQTPPPRTGAWLYGGKPILHKAWDEPPSPESGSREFYGGDLYGVLEGLPHLEALGVEAVYLTPIFQSPSVHRYDTQDYLRVDPHLGGMEAFLALKEGLRRAGIRLVLDGVFNHTGNLHPDFQEALDPESPKRGMFTFRPDGSYASFYGVKTLPKVDYASPLAQERLILGENAPVRYWMRHADGWRLDVAHQIGEGGTNRNNEALLRLIARTAKAENPEAFVFGELSFDTVPTLRAHTLDGSMHYAGFAHPVMEWLSGRNVQGEEVRLSAKEAWRVLFDHYAALPLNLRHSMYTLIGSHDIPRPLWRLKGEVRRLEVAFGLLLAFPGSPGIYYGDEIGLSQANPYSDWRGDPYCRGTFPWDRSRWNLALLDWVRRLVALKRSEPALRRGGLLPLSAPPGVLAFRRRYQGEEVWVYASPDPFRLDLPPGTDLLSGRPVQGRLEAEGLLLFKPEKGLY